MKKMIYVFLAIAVASGAAAAGESEYDYPPEFTDLFEQFRVITPEEAQIDVALYGDDPWHTLAGGVILEPILISCMNGLPAYYLILSYNGEDDEILGEMEDVIRMLNENDGFNPEELNNRISALEPNWADFRTFGTPAWTYGGGPSYSTPYVPDLFVEFSQYFTSLKTKTGTEDFGRMKIYAAYTAITGPVFRLELRSRQDLYYMANTSTYDVDIISEEDLVGIFYERTQYIQNRFLEDAKGFFDKSEHWRKLLDQVDEVEKSGGYFKVREYVSTTDGGLDGYTIDDVPDFNRCTAPGDNYSGDCWVWSMVSDLVFHSQCEDEYGKGLVWRDYKNPHGKNETPKFDKGVYNWGYGTWHFGDEADERLT